MHRDQDGLLDASLLQQIDQLEQFRPGGRAELVAMYLESSARDLERCAAALSGHDADALRRAAHSLKGSSAGIGAMGLSRDAGQLELLAAATDLHGAAAALAGLQELQRRVREALLHWNGG